MYNIKETNFMTVDAYVKLVIINKVCNAKINREMTIIFVL